MSVLGRRPTVALSANPMIAVEAVDRRSVTPTAKSCSCQRPPLATYPARPFAFAEALAEVRLGLTAAVARRPVTSAPTVPPTAWIPNVSSASSYPKSAFSLTQKMNGIEPARSPMITEPVASTKPVAGVITTRPATAPEQKPMTEACFLWMNSSAAQVKDPTAVARVVVMKALAATTSAPRAEPALNPYHPTHSIAVPTMQRTVLCGDMISLLKPILCPSMMHRTRADQPDDMWTTVPPAKSMELIRAAGFQTPFMSPSAPQTMWASGK